MDNTEYTCHRFKGKHGWINLMIPNREPTKEEIVEIHKVIAEIIVKNSKQELINKRVAN